MSPLTHFPCVCVWSPPGISFTPKEVGEHEVNVRKNGAHVANSPFKIMVGQSEIGDASKVKVHGQGLVEGHTFEVAEFIVDTRNAGTAEQGIRVHLHSPPVPPPLLLVVCCTSWHLMYARIA